VVDNHVAWPSVSSILRRDDERWQTGAACSGEMGAVFYPPMRPEKKSVRLAREERAKAICALCPVRRTCLEHAVTNNERYGIWGGLTDHERRHLRAV